MDDATRLITHLQQKLAELDHKVAAYRQDMAAEFKRYSTELLENIPEEVSAEVGRAIAQSITSYPAISPALDQSSDSPPPASDRDRQSWRGRRSPPPFSIRADLVAQEPPASPAHNRDREFYGLFTPSYLPLLDSSHAPPRSPTSPTPRQATEEKQGDGEHENETEYSLVAQELQLPLRPNHARRATDETTSSVLSDRSDSKLRRSALRRSSSGSKPPPSPRRVRFEFDGGEVLPTASPHSADLLQQNTIASVSAVLEDDSISAESILGPDEINEPPPKKVSSSQALRALSRTPLDSSTVWTVVNSESQQVAAGKEKENMTNSNSSGSIHSTDTIIPTSAMAQASQAAKHEDIRTEKPLGKSRLDREDSQDNDDAESSDEEFLSMAKPKSFASKKAVVSPLSRSPPPSSKTTPSMPSTSASESTGQPGTHKAPEKKPVASGEDDKKDEEDEEDEEDELFYFEGLSAPPKPRSKQPATVEEEDEEEVEIPEDSASALSQYSSSPAVSMPQPPTTHMAHFTSGSVGSYRGRPVTMPIVTNQEVYAQAASLGGINSFIGGLDGRSGVDDGDMNSYRASVGQNHFSGTPRSLTERMMMEEAQARRRAAAQPH